MKPLRAFTLIEILVVIAIISLLSAVIYSALNTARIKARDASRVASLSQLRTALELYHDAHLAYPQTASWQSQCSAWGAYSANMVIPGLIGGGYISVMPQDPAMNVSSNLNCFLYRSDGTDYKLLDYNLGDTANPSAMKSFLDPMRNYAKPYAQPTLCPTEYNYWKDPGPDFSIYSPGAMCW